MIYWAKAGDTGAVKVGFAASDVAARIRLLQTGCPWPLILLRTEPGGRDLEAELHRHYRAKHLRAEWFALSDEDVATALPTVSSKFRGEAERALDSTPEAARVDGIIAALGGREAVASAYGVSRTAIYNWRRDGIPSRLWPDFVRNAALRGEVGVTFDALKATTRRARSAAGSPDPTKPPVAA